MAETGYVLHEPNLTSNIFPNLRLADEIPTRFISSQTSLTLNVAANTVLARSAPVPFGFAAKIEDFNINFTATGTGVAQLVRMTASGQILNTILASVTSSQSGIGKTVMGQGESIALIVGTQGTGTINSIDLSGNYVFIGNEVN